MQSAKCRIMVISLETTWPQLLRSLPYAEHCWHSGKQHNADAESNVVSMVFELTMVVVTLLCQRHWTLPCSCTCRRRQRAHNVNVPKMTIVVPSTSSYWHCGHANDDAWSTLVPTMSSCRRCCRANIVIIVLLWWRHRRAVDVVLMTSKCWNTLTCW